MHDASNRPQPAGVDEQILAEHRHIHELNRQLQAAAELPALLTCLAELRTFLVAHFVTEEEAGGFFDVVRSTSPRHTARVDLLAREHLALLAALDALRARATACQGEIAAVLEDARTLGRRLNEHEAAEDHVLLDSINTDIGQED